MTTPVKTTDLLRLGWDITRTPGGLGLHTKVEDWEILNWAQQTPLRASCGFDQSGDLSLTLAQMSASDLTWRAVRRATTQPDGKALPKGVTKGADQRLKQLLESTRTNLCDMSKDR